MLSGERADVVSVGTVGDVSKSTKPLSPNGKDSDGNDANSSDSPLGNIAMAANPRPILRKFRASESVDPEVSNKESVVKGGGAAGTNLPISDGNKKETLEVKDTPLKKGVIHKNTRPDINSEVGKPILGSHLHLIIHAADKNGNTAG